MGLSAHITIIQDGKSKSRGTSQTKGSSTSNSHEFTNNVEKDTNATLSFKDLESGKIYKLSFKCNRNLDAKIRCFNLDESREDVIKDTSLSVEGFKALKELLDIGVITQEEFDLKKKQILGI